MNLKPIVSLLALSTFGTNVIAQSKITLSGYISEAQSGEKLSGAIIKIADTEEFANTNEFGYFSIQIPKGATQLKVHHQGYLDTTFTLLLQNSQQINLSLHQGKILDEIVVKARNKQVEQIGGNTHYLKAEDVKNVPAILGEKDVFKVVKLLPGVQKGVEGSSGFNVRGGNTDQNLILLDDAIIYNPSHILGFISAFNGDAVKGIELIKGGYPAKYGGRLSSVLNVNLKEGDKQRYKGEIGLGLLSSRATLEGPIKKDKSSFLISARRSYIDVLATPIIKLATEGIGIGAHFYDFNAKANYEINDKNHLYFSAYLGRDQFSTKEKSNAYLYKGRFGWGNRIASLRWSHVINPKWFGNITANYTGYDMTIINTENYDNETYKLKFTSAIQDLGIKYDLSYFANSKHTFRMGYRGTRHYFEPSVLAEISNGQRSPSNQKTYESFEQNVYIDDEWKITQHMAANIGIRGAAFSSKGKTYWNAEPRGSLRLLLCDQSSIKASYTMMHQYLHLLSTSSLSLPTDLWVPSTAKIGPQRATQYALGFFQDFQKPNISLSIEGYYKSMENIKSFKEGSSFFEFEDPADLTENSQFEDKITTGKGHSYGAEIMVQKPKGKFNGWLSYTLSWTKYQFPDINLGKYFYPKFDRRHDLNLVGFYELSPRVKINALFTVATGNPIIIAKQNATSLPQIPLDGNLSNLGEYLGSHGLYRDRSEIRSELYHRLDLGIQFIRQRKKGTRTWEIGFYNVYNRQNAFFYNRETHYSSQYGSRTDMYKYTIFPFLPSFTYSFKFK